MGILRTEMSDGAFESYWWVHSKSDPKKIFLHVDHPKVGRGVTSPGDVGSAYTPQKSVLLHWAFYCSYKDERWCVRKLLVSTFQIWSSKIYFCIWITRKSRGGSDVTGDGGSASTPGKSVLWHWAFCCSYGDERWQVRKLIMSRTQIWHQKILCIQLWRESGRIDVTAGSHQDHNTWIRWFTKLCCFFAN